MKTYRIHVNYKVTIPKTAVFNIQAESLEAALNKVEEGKNLPGVPVAAWRQTPGSINVVEGNYVPDSFQMDYMALAKQYQEPIGWRII